MKLKFNLKVEKIFEKIINKPKIKRILESILEYDIGLYLHSIRVSILCIDIGVGKNFKDRELVQLGVSGILHDFGKVFVPIDILNKKKELRTENEQKILYSIPRRTFSILKNFECNFIRKVIIAHHEFYKTNSFPRKRNENGEFEMEHGRRKEEKKVEEFAQILSIANLFESALPDFHQSIQIGSQNKLILYIKDEFLGSQSNVNELISRI